MHEPKGRSLRCVLLPVQLQVDPERHPGLGIIQLDLGGLHARRREADDNVDPPVVGDGVSDQHVPQFAPPRDVFLSLARQEAASTHQRYGLLGWAFWSFFSFVSNIRASMLRRGLGVAAVLLVFASPARAGTLGLAEVRSADGTLIGKAGAGAYAYPADGSILRIGSSRTDAARVELRDVSMFNGRITVRRLVVPSRGLGGARIDGLVVDGTGYVVGPNAIIPLDGGSYVVALQEAVSPGRTGSGLVGLRAFVADPSLGLAPGTQLLVGLARAAHPDAATSRAAAVLGLPQLPAAQASMSGVPTFLARDILPPTNTLGGQAVALAYRYLGVPYVWGGELPSGFDCSGLTMYVYGQLGIKLGHYTGFQYYAGLRVPRDQLEPGDLVFFHANSAGVPGHEGMYIGNGSFIHAPHTGDVVRISSLFETRYALAYVGAVRPYAAGAAPASLSTWTSLSG
jgi:cell wall-associated NlpC family hydrolase